MSVYLPSVGGKEPYWGPQTSHMNFCEEDYHLTAYIGEFINTITSLFYAYLGATAMVHGLSRGERSLPAFLPHICFIVLGLASAVFHLTLKYYMQLLDDNSMLFGASVVLHRLLTHGTSQAYSLSLAIGLTTGVLLAIYAHIQLGESTFHQIVFASIMLTSAFMTARTITKTIKDEDEKWQMRKLGMLALGLFLSGYGLWNIDNLACEHLREIRHSIGLPWAWLFELHGWWHILTGMGAFLHTVMVDSICPLTPFQEIPLESRLPWLRYLGWSIRTKKE